MNMPVHPNDETPREVRARVLHGKIEPLEELELEEGEEVVILVQHKRKKETTKEVLKRTAGAWAGTLDFDQFLRDIHERRKKQQRPPVDLDR